jgi:hypothetical protein
VVATRMGAPGVGALERRGSSWKRSLKTICGAMGESTSLLMWNQSSHWPMAILWDVMEDNFRTAQSIPCTLIRWHTLAYSATFAITGWRGWYLRVLWPLDTWLMCFWSKTMQLMEIIWIILITSMISNTWTSLGYWGYPPYINTV